VKPDREAPRAAHEIGHGHGHGHGHQHVKDEHGREHEHAGSVHRHEHAAHHQHEKPESPVPRTSLLMSSAVHRMAGATVLTAMLWVAVAWALSGSP
jgi:ABC-type Zn2+ transport system substrate-binding protein/surface adhesin